MVFEVISASSSLICKMWPMINYHNGTKGSWNLVRMQNTNKEMQNGDHHRNQRVRRCKHRVDHIFHVLYNRKVNLHIVTLFTSVISYKIASFYFLLSLGLEIH